MAPKLPLPRGWKRRVRSSVLHILALGNKLPDSTIYVSFFKRPKSVDGYTQYCSRKIAGGWGEARGNAQAISIWTSFPSTRTL